MGWESSGVVRFDKGQMRIPKLKSAYNSLIMSTPLGVDILFLLFPPSAVRHAWFLVISRKSIYPIFTKFGMCVYWVNCLHGIAFGEDSSITE